MKPLDNLADNGKKIFWDNFDDYFKQNEQTIRKAMNAKFQSAGADDKGSNVVAEMNTFMDTLSVILNVLDTLGHAHPVLEGDYT